MSSQIFLPVVLKYLQIVMKPKSSKLNGNIDIEQKKVPGDLSDLQFLPGASPVSFYDQYRKVVIAGLKKKGDTVTWQNNRVLREDEELSPTFEELILDKVLGLIDTRLPGHVRSHYFDLTEGSNSLMEHKNDILDKVPSFLEEMKNGVTSFVRSGEGQMAR